MMPVFTIVGDTKLPATIGAFAGRSVTATRPASSLAGSTTAVDGRNVAGSSARPIQFCSSACSAGVPFGMSVLATYTSTGSALSYTEPSTLRDVGQQSERGDRTDGERNYENHRAS